MNTFLVLEDEPFISMDLQFAFEDAGYSAVSAVDNEEAFAHIADRIIKGAILDVNLGGGQTCEPTAMKLKELSIPFVLHTGDLDRAGEHLRGLKAPVIAKPRPADDVVSQIVKLADETQD
jgi:DNA-binding NtrC family response regulator